MHALIAVKISTSFIFYEPFIGSKNILFLPRKTVFPESFLAASFIYISQSFFFDIEEIK